MSRMQPLPHTTCPLCGGPNDCAPAACGRLDVDCWCSAATIGPGVLARVPPEQRRRACVCRRCARGDAVRDAASPPSATP